MISALEFDKNRQQKLNFKTPSLEKFIQTQLEKQEFIDHIATT
jgi:hypothetical protein